MGARAAGREGGIIETGKPGGRASEIWLEEKRKAASGFLGVGAYLSGRWKHLKNRLFYGFLLFYSRFTVLLIFRFGENWGKQIFLYFV